jgi:hypothetical protein
LEENFQLRQKVVNNLAYLQLMGSFEPNTDFKTIKDIITTSSDFIHQSSEALLNERLPALADALEKMVSNFRAAYPVKKPIDEIATSFNNFFKAKNPIYETGLEFGWLDSCMDLKKLRLYDDLPYHYKIGLGAHKGNGGIEEDNLLKDAFNSLVKVEESLHLLNKTGERLKEKEQKGSYQFTPESYRLITDLKYEVCFYSRLSVIAFYSFVECFINSVGFDYLFRNRSKLTETESEALRGFRKGRYCSLDYKIEKYQSLIRADRRPLYMTTDPAQITNPFKDFFEYYESLRNASVHYSPEKDRIWLTPQQWEYAARDFSKTAMDVALEFWSACYPSSDGPKYLGKLYYDLHKRLAIERKDRIAKIKEENNL